jgi:hypothetical protein
VVANENVTMAKKAVTEAKTKVGGGSRSEQLLCMITIHSLGITLGGARSGRGHSLAVFSLSTEGV